jgi:hypothetical protein
MLDNYSGAHGNSVIPNGWYRFVKVVKFVKYVLKKVEECLV